MKTIDKEPLTDLSVEAFERILKGKLKGLMLKKVIGGIESVEKSQGIGKPHFTVRIVYGENSYLDLIITSQRKVGQDQFLFAEHENGRWSGSSFAKYVEDSVTNAMQHAKGRDWKQDAEMLRKGRLALDTGRPRLYP